MRCFQEMFRELKILRNKANEIFYEAYIQAEGLYEESLQMILHEYRNDVSDSYVYKVTKKVFGDHEDEISIIREKITTLTEDEPVEIARRIRHYCKDDKQKLLCSEAINRSKLSLNKLFKEYIVLAASDLEEYVNEFCVILNENKDITTEDEFYDALIEKNKFEFKHIYTSREMIKYAESLGYEFKRCKGSHANFEHKKTHKSIPIVTHEIGKGLSYRMQKDLLDRCK